MQYGKIGLLQVAEELVKQRHHFGGRGRGLVMKEGSPFESNTQFEFCLVL